MKFELWEALKLDGDLEFQKEYFIKALTGEVTFDNVRVDDEGIFKADLTINCIDDLLRLPSIVSDNIVIYGLDSDLIMSKRTMVELGLD